MGVEQGPMDGRLQEGAPAALYEQVKAFVHDKLRSGEWKPGDRIPSEAQLVGELGVSRMTVNRALRELSEQGKLVRLSGVGTFVAEAKPQSTLLMIANIADEIRARGHVYSCKVLRLAREAAPLEVAAALALPTGASVFHAICVHRENGVPVQLEDRFVNPAMVPDFIHQTFDDTMQPSAYLLRTVPAAEIEHIVDAAMPTPAEAELLEVAPTQPCLVLVRRTWSAGRAVTFVRFVHPASRYRLGSRFSTGSEHGTG